MNPRNLMLRTRTSLAFGCICLLLVIIGVCSTWQLRSVDEAVTDLHENWLASVRHGGRIQNSLLLYRLDIRRFMLDEQRMSANSLATLNDLRGKLKAETQSYANMVTSPEERRIYEQVSAGVENYIAAAEKVIATGSTATIQDLARAVNSSVQPLAIELQSNVERLIAINQQGADASSDRAHEIQHFAVYLVTGLSVAAIVLTILIAQVLVNSIVGPVRSLVKATEQIANGNLRAEIAPQGQDELSQLETATVAMRDNLRSMIDMIGQSSGQLSAAAEQLNGITAETSQSALQQSHETDQAATAVNEMTAAVEEVARNASSASRSSQQSEQSAILGQDKVNVTISSIKRLSESVRGTRGDVEDLALKSRDIAKVLDVIRTIAEQTNLLALNAAIEAARAGEQGRGFAVVADEVRALAHRTQLSTQEIEKMISEIQTNSEAAVTSMRRSDTEASETLTSAHDAGEAIQQIAAAISDINERNLLIASASEEQAQVARSVDENLVSIRDLSLRSSTAASQTTEASHELSRLATQLNTMVNRFVI